MFGPFFVPGGGAQQATAAPSDTELERLREQLRAGELDDEEVQIDVADTSSPFMQIFGMHGMEEMEVNLRDMLGQLPGFKGKTKRRTVKVPEALELLEQQEADKLVDMDRVKNEALERTAQAGIVFLDEIDKVAGRQKAGSGPDVSREGVQRDLLPIVEGSTVSTKYGPVKTDHILFIAAGAFHVAEVSDLIPELQGRFPIRVELDSLEKEDFVRILTEPRNSLTKQYQALIRTEGIELEFTEDAVEALAEYAQQANTRSENIGARRLHTILEALLEEVSFVAPEMSEDRLKIDAAMVKSTLQPILSDDDLAKYIL
jgi:ATP-dependent HslUV protease ATP-binding subunit HslU